MTAPSVSVETITPETAHELLGRNTKNRNVDPRTVGRYAQLMRCGQWLVGGSTIDVDVDGNLTNGQHRLLACIEAGAPFTTVVVRGVDPSVFEVIDTGHRRTFGNVLHMKGEVNTAALAASVALAVKWKTDRLLMPGNPSNPDMIAWLDVNPSIRDALRRSSITKSVKIPPSAAANFVHQASLIDYEECDGYLKRLADGENLSAGDPILAMRNWSLNQATRRYSTGSRPSSVVFLALLVKSWNFWITGREVRSLAWKRGGNNREDFPVLVDGDGRPQPPRDEVVLIDTAEETCLTVEGEQP